MNEKKKAKLGALYDFIVQYQHEHGRPPTRRGMVEAGFAASTSSIAIYLDELAEMGKIEITPGTANGIKLIDVDFNNDAAIALLKEAEQMIKELQDAYVSHDGATALRRKIMAFVIQPL